ncbi:MAG: LL-diaminopimelate aminotransferase [Firmicutes bacterium]|nr:LL-diaminopimelate aminotransferase [Bacillota bacterium]MCL5038280.1 LL-diaminopimelate aminotransferase [Bacillota bacterium]
MQLARRIDKVPPYLFAEIDKKKKDALARGVDIINLGIGDPDQPTPAFVVDALREHAGNPKTHRYPDYEGSPEFRQAMAQWYEKRFGVRLDPNKEAMTLIGSKEGLAHLIWAFVDPGDYTLIPDPAYPVYKTHTLLAGGTPYPMPLLPENGFLPDFGTIPEEVWRRAKIMFLNYPNNPTAAVADKEFYREAVALARKYDLLLAHDAAYAEMTFDGFVAPSVLEIPGAKDVAIEFYSFSKPFNMTGWRIAAALGNAQAVAALGIIKTNTDSGQFTAVQWAALEAFRHDPENFFGQMNRLYQGRRDVVIDGLNSLGWRLPKTKGTFYVWIPVPPGHTSASFTAELLDRAGVIVVPGTGYGEKGEGFVRIALTVPEARLREAVDRIRPFITL